MVRWTALPAGGIPGSATVDMWIPSRVLERNPHEEVAIHGKPEHRYPQRSKGWGESADALPQSRHQRGDAIQLAFKVRGLQVCSLRLLRDFEDETRRLKKIVADQPPNIEALKIVGGGRFLASVQRRAAVQAVLKRRLRPSRSV